MEAKNQLQQTIDQFRAIVHTINTYDEAVGVLYWDLRTSAPRKSSEYRGDVIGLLSTEAFKRLVSDEMGALIERLRERDADQAHDHITRKMLDEYERDYTRSKKIPVDEYQEYVTLTAKSEAVWEEAKDKADFTLFQPYLEQIVAYNKKFVEYWGYEEHPYDALLDAYEPGMTVAKLDPVFSTLKQELVKLTEAIAGAKQPDDSFMHQPFDVQKQQQFSRFMLTQMGYDFEAGRLDESVHPFAIGLNPGDVRITTAFQENDFTFSLFSTIHEGGHALYEQNMDPKLHGTGLRDGASMGIHESQSRLWENMIGRSRALWERYYGKLQDTFPGAFDDVTLEQFYDAINLVRPSLIRIEADELTYNLHIMIRYELEKALFEGEIDVCDLPAAWNEKYREYLGVSPKNDGEGVLQDVHWSDGSFGYFPSYALGNMYAAQIMHSMDEALGGVDRYLSAGNLLPLRDWLTEQMYTYGKTLTPAELMVKVTGEELNPEYLVRYFQQKFSTIYDIR